MIRLFCAALLALAATAARAAPSLEAYAAYPAMEMVRLSPSGDRFAYVGGAGIQRKLFVYTSSGEPLKIIDLGNVTATALAWAGEDHLILEVHSTQKIPAYALPWNTTQAFSLNLRTGAGFWVFSHGTSMIYPAVFGFFGAQQRDGRWFGYFAGYGAAKVALWQVDLDTGTTTQTDEPPAHGMGNSYVNWLFVPDRGAIARTDYEWRTSKWGLFALTAPPEKARLIASNDHDTFGSASLTGLGRDTGSVAYYAPDQEQVLHLFEAPLDGGRSPEELAVGLDVSGPIFDPRTKLLVGLALDAMAPKYVWFRPDIESKVRAAERALAGRDPRLVDWSSGFSRIVVHTHGDQDPGTYWLVDNVAGRADIIGDVWTGIRPEDVNPVQLVDYRAADGTPLQAVLTLPKGRTPLALPVVVLPHGGPYDHDGESFNWIAQAFASLGYAVVQPNYRGSSGYGQAFRRAAYGQWGRKVQTDVSDAIAAVAAQGKVDPKRACVMGVDYGGYIALAGVTVQHGLYRCAVSVAGVSSLVGIAPGYRAPNPQSRYWRNFLGLDGAQPVSEATLRDLSPRKIASRADAPVLLLHDLQDTRISSSESVLMKEALEAAGKPVELVMVEGDDRGLSTQETRTTILKTAAAFIQKYNPPN